MRKTKNFQNFSDQNWCQDFLISDTNALIYNPTHIINEHFTYMFQTPSEHVRKKILLYSRKQLLRG